MKDQELEIKYYVQNLRTIENCLQNLGALVKQPRTHEINLRFDTPGGELGRTMRVLRLRRDTAARLTYKGPARSVDGVRARKEIEFVVSDFDAARTLFELLGYQVVMVYEKYRAEYDLDGVLVTLDEMPYGDFVEIEGPDSSSIHETNQRLALDWDARISESYVMLFNRLKAELALDFRDLTFENFKGLEITAAALNAKPADVEI